MAQNLGLRCVLISDPSTLGAGAKTRLESRIKEFTPHCVYRQTHGNPSISNSYITPIFQNGAKSGFEMCFGPRTLGAGAKTRLHTPKAVAYHEQPHYCRFMIGHSLGRMDIQNKEVYATLFVCRTATPKTHAQIQLRVSVEPFAWERISSGRPAPKIGICRIPCKHTTVSWSAVL